MNYENYFWHLKHHSKQAVQKSQVFWAEIFSDRPEVCMLLKDCLQNKENKIQWRHM